MATDAQPLFELRQATVVRDGHCVLHDVSFSIGAGDHAAVLGPNGAGKSILLNLLTCQDRPRRNADGTDAVRLFGSADWPVFELRSRLGVVSPELHQRFVQGNAEGRITGEAAVLSGFVGSQGILRYSRVTGEMRRRAAGLLEQMGVAHLLRRRLNDMSTGEARRVLLARALVTKPAALLLDEPTSGLDLVARHQFLESVRVMMHEGTTTVVLVTHHVEEILPEIQQVILLKEGRLAAAGPAREILTAERLTRLFDVPIRVEQSSGYFYARL